VHGSQLNPGEGQHELILNVTCKCIDDFMLDPDVKNVRKKFECALVLDESQNFGKDHGTVGACAERSYHPFQTRNMMSSHLTRT